LKKQEKWGTNFLGSKNPGKNRAFWGCANAGSVGLDEKNDGQNVRRSRLKRIILSI